jgi:hypothetical protein
MSAEEFRGGMEHDVRAHSRERQRQGGAKVASTTRGTPHSAAMSPTA